MSTMTHSADDAPAPLVPADCDCTDLDGFMLNVERLMASELVALASHEEIAAAVFLWCRAWKQKPAASLPDDDRVNAAFARLPLAKFRRCKDQIMHGFVKCSDGRLYHRFLAAEAVNAYERKIAFQKRKVGDAERLRKWRQTQSETRSATAIETHDETRFVAEGQGQGQGPNKTSEPNGSGGNPPSTSEFIYAKGRELLAQDPKKPKDPGALISKWLRENGDDSVMAALRACEAKRTPEPIRFITAMLAKSSRRDDLYAGVI